MSKTYWGDCRCKKVVVCVKLATQWIILVLHLNVLPIMLNLTSADKGALKELCHEIQPN